MIKIVLSDENDKNIAYHVNDNIENVNNNRRKLALKYRFDLKNLKYMNQIHGNDVQIVGINSPSLIDNCDALITSDFNIPIMVMVADCIPIVLKDESRGVVAVIHAGRNSTFLRIVEKTALIMIEKFSCKKENMQVFMGPSIQKCCYEVSNELEEIAKKSFGDEFCQKRMLDLQGINKKLLNDIGIFNIEISDICTKCSNKPYFSYRKDKYCGRFSIIAWIEK